MTATIALDREGLLAALVLAPATYSRNRFFELYKRDNLLGTRRRAAQIRSLVRAIVRGDACEREVDPDGGVRMTFTAPELGLKRTTWLDAFEAAVFDVAMARARSESAPSESDQRVRIALSRLQGPPIVARTSA